MDTSRKLRGSPGASIGRLEKTEVNQLQMPKRHAGDREYKVFIAKYRSVFRWSDPPLID